MGSIADFASSVLADAMVPVLRTALGDAVLEVLNDRQVPTRADYRELRDLLDRLRGEVASTQTGLHRLEERVAKMEQVVERLAEAPTRSR